MRTAWARHGMCELTRHGMAGERHENGMGAAWHVWGSRGRGYEVRLTSRHRHLRSVRNVLPISTKSVNDLQILVNIPNAQLVTGWTVRGSNPGGGARFSAPVQKKPGAHPHSYTTGIMSFPVVKRPGCVVDYPPLSSAEVKERVMIYLYSLSGSLWPVLG
jgi:hypothetical protein